MKLSNAVVIVGVLMIGILYASRRPMTHGSEAVTPAEQMALSSDVKSTAAAVDAGASADGNPGTGFPPLMFAAFRGDEASVELLLDRGARPDGWNGFRPLQFAVARGRGVIAEMLLERGADPDARTNRGVTALHVLAARPDLDVGLIQLLLAHGARTDLQDADGRTPLDVAMTEHHMAAVRMLTDAAAGARIDVEVLQTSP